MSTLELSKLAVCYGMIQAVQEVSLRVEPGEVVALIGPNGAGKSSTLLAILGLIRSSGAVRFNGRDISGLASHRIVQAGLALVPEGRRMIGSLTVEENLEMGAYNRRGESWRQDLERLYRRFDVLGTRRNQLAQTLSGGEQQMLALARALIARPSLILLDEPSMGLAPLVVRQVFEIIREVNAEGMTVLLVEQNARAALKIAHRAYIMESGRFVAEGAPQDLLHDAQLVSAYLS